MQYHISALQLRLIDVTIILLSALIWFAGFYGYDKIQSYCKLIKNSKDGKHIAKLSRGILFLILWLPVSSVLSAILNYIAMKHPGWLSATAIINIYVSLLLPLIGFFFISQGTYGLTSLVRQRP